jgi:hypothetical protein
VQTSSDITPLIDGTRGVCYSVGERGRMTAAGRSQKVTTIQSSSGRQWDPRVTLQQIGAGNVLAISGGRWKINGVGDLILPVAAGYSVEIAYDASDTYTVRRVFTRGIKRWVKGEMSYVYCEDVGEAAYRASCYLDAWADA